ncbi:uncharacterized protein LOC130528461 isoform X4 [Takifugu flavidus]|uniref:uncharacterized protein LOC130528461 isoform X4 n=1 Tax=Takifugu flavidus TaxID=433684 RepID=UPI002544CC00|nr:uncharacterized protein LOC130528461 isoform X4 [Takifugu flavidus]
MRNLCFTSLCFILSFYASIEHSAGSAAPDPPQQLTCNGTKNPDGSFTYRLVPAPTVNEYTSFSWAKNSITFADDGNKTADVLKLTKDSVTLKLCQENVTYENHGANPQEASCHVDCSGHVRTTPSANHPSDSPDAQLTCNGTKNPDGSFTYQLVPAPTVTEYTSFRWAKNSITFAENGNKTADVLNLTNDSVTLKLCQENVTYENHGANPQKASCHVDCSGHVRTTPSDDHRWCLSDDWCPPVVGAVVLVLVGALALVFYGRIHPRCSRGSEEEPSVKSSSAVEDPLPEMKTVSESH